jgi:hypothetical protein
VLFVYAANIDEVLPGQLAEPLAVALLVATVALAACSLLLRSIRRGAILATAVVVAWFAFGHLATQLEDALGEPVPEVLLLVGWLGVIILVGIYAARARGSLATVTAALNAFALVLVVISLVTILPNETSRAVRASEGEPIDSRPVARATRHPDRDIYYLVFDRYGSEWSLEHAFGVESDLPEDLEARGFQVIPGARANYHASDFSIATTLNLDYVTNLVDVARPSTDRTPVRELLTRHEVGRFMRANGYRYVHLGAWWEPTRSSPIADDVLALGKTTELGSVIDGASVVPAARRLLGMEHEDAHDREQHREQALFAFRQVMRLAPDPSRTFTFAHILMPHPPYVLDADGRAIFDAEAKARSEAELLQGQLDFTDDRIREIVDALLAGPDDEDPIIVLAADEGPYLCYEVDCVDGSAEQYGIRLGVLRAYYLPGREVTIPADDSGVNIFRMILREYFGVDLPDLPNRSYAWVDRETDLYALKDVTDILPLPGR